MIDAYAPKSSAVGTGGALWLRRTVGSASDSRRCPSVHGVPRQLAASGGSPSEVVKVVTVLARPKLAIVGGYGFWSQAIADQPRASHPFHAALCCSHSVGNGFISFG